MSSPVPIMPTLPGKKSQFSLTEAFLQPSFLMGGTLGGGAEMPMKYSNPTKKTKTAPDVGESLFSLTQILDRMFCVKMTFFVDEPSLGKSYQEKNTGPCRPSRKRRHSELLKSCSYCLHHSFSQTTFSIALAEFMVLHHFRVAVLPNLDTHVEYHE